MDEYSLYCYKKLSKTKKGKKFLKERGFDSMEDIINAPYQKIETKEHSKILDGIECKNCKSKNTLQVSSQTRSLDEGETVYLICNDCNRSYIF